MDFSTLIVFKQNFIQTYLVTYENKPKKTVLFSQPNSRMQ